VITCPNCGRENPEGFQFCGYCRTELAPSTSTAREVRKTVTVVFTDVTGSTNLGERLDPESMRRIMGRYFEAMKAVLERHGGTVEKFIGDAVMSVFGVPSVHEDDALRAVRAAVEMAEALEELNKEFERDQGVRIETRTGVNTGQVVAGDPSTGQTLVTGDAVNVAARLQQAAQPGEILIGGPTYRLVRDAVTVGESRSIQAKGKAEPVQALPLIEVLDVLEGLQRRVDSPMVGRDRELRLLGEAFERAVSERTCHLFTLLGSAGVGKSRLVEEALRVIGGQAQALRGRCLPYGEGITFWPVMEVIKDAAGIGEGDLPQDVRPKITAWLEDQDDQEAIAARLMQIFFADEGVAASEELFWAVRKFLEALGRRTSVVVVFDDIQWGEATFLDLIEHLAGWSRDAPILLLCVARPDLLDRRSTWGGGKLNATSLLLEPLTDDQSSDLIENLLGQAKLAEGVQSQVLSAAEGNPLFVEQMVSMLIDDGMLERDDGHWRPVGDFSRLTVPPTIQALLSARLDRLDVEERAVIERASVVGKSFYRGAIAELAQPDLRPRVPAHLMTLVRKELIRPDRSDFAGEEAFRFRHILIRDAAYEAMPKQLRADLHEAFADWLERASGSRSKEYDEIIGYHLEQAFRYRAELGPVDERGTAIGSRAARLLESAGRRAMERVDHAGAANLLDRAAHLLPADDAARGRLELALADALNEIGEFGRSVDIAAGVAERARQREDRREELLAELHRLSFVQEVGPEGFAGESEPVIAAAIELFERIGDDAGLALAWRLRSFVYNMLGTRQPQIAAFERAIEHDRRAGDRSAELQDIALLSSIYFWGPTPVDEALPRCLELLELVGGSRYHEARIERYAAGLMGMQGRFEEAREILERARETFREFGNQVMVASMGFLFGALETWAGRLDTAAEELRSTCETFLAMGEKTWLSSLAGLLGEVLYWEGRGAEAEHWVEVARQSSAPDDLSSQAHWRAVQAMVLASKERFGEAEPLAREAVDIAKRTDEIEHVGHRLMALAEVLRLAGRAEAAVPIVREAIGRYQEKGVKPSVERAHRMLEQLASA
jgi:predicted ATPase/class 3 adenylate cyclase